MIYLLLLLLLSPLSAKEHRPPDEKRQLIVLDAGHGGKDYGAHSVKNKYEEKTLTLMTAKIVKGYLSQMGYEVVMTRRDDTTLTLERRAEMANRLKAELFVSIHYNTAPNPQAEGIEIYYYKDEKNPYSRRIVESKKLGDKVLKLIAKHTGADARGVKRANFAVIRETKMPSILIECGFLSHPGERDKILDLAYRKYLAWGIAAGIDTYLRERA